MPRMRTLKPEACSSETLAAVPREVRWTFGCLWTHCDDEGRAVWNPRLVKAAIYPLDDDVTLGVLTAEIEQLAAVGSVCMYEIDGREYLHVPSWADHQHPNRKVPSKLPPCPKTDHSASPHAQRSEPAVSPPERLTPVVVVGDVDGEGVGGGGVRASDGHPAPPTGAIGRIIRAYVDAAQAAGVPSPKESQGRIERSARSLFSQGYPEPDLVEAARNAAVGGWTDLATQLQRDAARANPTSNPKGSTTDQRFRAANDLADLLERKAIG